MAMLWNKEMERLYMNYRHSTKAWELLHEEMRFEDLGFQADRMLSDLDGQETHMHFHEIAPKDAMRREKRK